MSKETNSSGQSDESTRESFQWNGFSKAELLTQLEKILSSPEFSNSPRMTRFLRFTVDKTLRGEEEELKEYLLGIAVFDRSGEYDPHVDPIVRVEARRLRSKLSLYYESEGRFDPILIECPKGHYVPVFTKNNDFRTNELNEAPQIAEPIDEAQEGAEKENERSVSRIFLGRWKLSFVTVLVALIAGSLVFWRVRLQPEKLVEKPKEMSFRALTSYSDSDPLDSASISPDGKYLAFCLKGKVFMQDIHTGVKRPLDLPEGFYADSASWFPDGTKLLLSRAEERWIQSKGEMILQSDLSVWSLSILGGTPQEIVDHTTFPSISPDGSLVAFGRDDVMMGTAEIWVVKTNGESPRRIRTLSESERVEYFNPVWSSTGQRLFFFRSDNKGRTIESCDLRGEKITTIFSLKDYAFRWGLCWAPDGRILFPMAEPGPRVDVFNLWEIKVDAVTGQPMRKARRFIQWSGFSFTTAGSLSITADGKQLALVRANAQTDVYVAEAEVGGKAMKKPRRLTLVESNDAVWDWTADSRAVLFVSDRNGNQDIFKQNISQTEAEVIVNSPEYESHPNLSPDQAFILYLVSEKPGPMATRLMRIPVGSGPPEPVLTGEKITNFSCAREANLCVVVEEVDGKQILTTFDPLKGRGEKLPISDFPNFEDDRQDLVRANRILSPQGRLIEKMRPGPEGFHIRVRSIIGGAVEEIAFKNVIGDYHFSGWSLDGKGIYLWEWASSGFTVLYAGLDGHSKVFWKRGSSPGHTIGCPIPSPDGRHLAFTVVTYEANAWLLENF